ncbi:hypothetical protein LTR48_000764 [Friedmanniomyces endolithicus]|uniref:NAD(P)-binding domain-containing protein n=1 Tax=Rachicladosporium monterosium TaxID=1507873 RepID=A0ABR0LEQ9_9PEZI|nr:hypothetical protein LTR29_011234 [Friedmanniomyces endolithicus]KAK1094220.1 hypothetical protein LTR48_000764 [Friedmanniomyces endolithicus]KAK5147650.1 hypothetical protein LTR32_000930 [Rachicladosporium monterosium]
MPLPILLTGVTGGLGAAILHTLLHTHALPPSTLIATSRSESNRSHFASQDLHFRLADYARPETLLAAFEGIGDLLFMSSSERDNAKRLVEHRNVVEAAKAKGVGRVWYVSLALGGFGNGSRAAVMQAHIATEEMLKSSGLDFITLRAGSYSEAFPLFLNWYPSSTTILLPNLMPSVAQGKAAWTSRDELGEGIAALLAKGLAAYPSIIPQTDRNIILLTGPVAEPPSALVEAINRGRGTDIRIEFLEPEAWVQAQAKHDEGGKGVAWFRSRLVWLQGLAEGDCEVVDSALEVLLGRRPATGPQAVERLVRAEAGYTWHQNYVGPRK